MVVVGVTTFEVVPRTEPIFLSIVKVVAAPPESVHAKVVELPEAIAAGVAVKVEITGAGIVIVYAAEATAELVQLDFIAIALIIAFADKVNGALYKVELAVGAVPFVV